jgi:phospholipid/cholesterol/gamma-HCH transport system substrate-binding protein
MGTAIRKHLRDFIAVAGLIVVALAVTGYLVQKQRLRIPILQQKPFELKAEFQTAQAVTPGQGQTVVVAGVKIGDISNVQLDNGVAVVTMDIDRKFLPIYKNATALIRPRTGLQDVFVELDPGTRSAGEYQEGDTIPVKNTQPEVNLDQILEALDGDTQAYLRLLIVGGGQGTKGQAKNLGKLLGGLGPINRELATLNREVAKRRTNIADLVHNLNLLTGAVGKHGAELAQFVDSSNAALGAIASQDSNVQRAVALLPGTLKTAHTALNKTAPFAKILGPTFNNLRPFVRNLPQMNASIIRAAKTTPIIRDEIRPLVRTARKPVRDLGPASKRLAKATPRLTTVATKLNKLGNMAAYNPGGAQPVGSPNRQEGYLYWLAWLAHDGNSVFQSQDANGTYRRIYFTAPCGAFTSILAGLPLSLGPLATPFQALFNPGRPCGP